MEKVLEQIAGCGFLDTGNDFDRVIESAECGDWEHGTRAARSRVADAEDKSRDTRQYDGPGAHRTRFFGDKQCATFQTPITERGGGLCQREHLGVRRGILEEFDLVVGARNDFGIADDDRADGHFAVVVCRRACRSASFMK